MAEPRPVGFAELARSTARVASTPRFHREQPLGELERAHLHREEDDRPAGLGGDVARHAEREAGLPHAGAGGEDHEVRALQPVQHLVDLVEAGGHADELAVVAVARLELVERVLQRVADADHRVGDAPFGDLEHERLGAVEGLGDVVGGVVAHLGDVAGDADEPAQQRELVDDARVVTGVRRRRGAGLDLQQRGRPPTNVEQVGAAQLLGDGDRVGGLALPVQRLDGLVDVPVRRLVEVAGLDVRLDRGGDRVAREQHRAEQRLLGLEVVRRDPTARASTHRIRSSGPLPLPASATPGLHHATRPRSEGEQPVHCVGTTPVSFAVWAALACGSA